MCQKIQELWLDTQEGDRLVERYQQDIRICKENGIPMVVMHLTGEFARFKDRIFAVHLHDNDKNEDLHLLPFDGTIDWKRIVRELQGCWVLVGKNENISGLLIIMSISGFFAKCLQYLFFQKANNKFVSHKTESGFGWLSGMNNRR